MKIIFTGVSNLPSSEQREAVKSGLSQHHYFYMSEDFGDKAPLLHVLASFDDTQVEIWPTNRDDRQPEHYWRKTCLSLDEARRSVEFITDPATLMNVEVMTANGFHDAYLQDRMELASNPAAIFNKTIHIDVNSVPGSGGQAVVHWLHSIFRFRNVPCSVLPGKDGEPLEPISQVNIDSVINSMRERGIRVTIGHTQAERQES
jgi:hypothetical protein